MGNPRVRGHAVQSWSWRAIIQGFLLSDAIFFPAVQTETEKPSPLLQRCKWEIPSGNVIGTVCTTGKVVRTVCTRWLERSINVHRVDISGEHETNLPLLHTIFFPHCWDMYRYVLKSANRSHKLWKPASPYITPHWHSLNHQPLAFFHGTFLFGVWWKPTESCTVSLRPVSVGEVCHEVLGLYDAVILRNDIFFEPFREHHISLFAQTTMSTLTDSRISQILYVWVFHCVRAQWVSSRNYSIWKTIHPKPVHTIV